MQPDFAPPTARPTTELLVALDIDGTILHHDGWLSERVREAITTLDRSGATVMVATGRSVVATIPVLEQLDLQRAGSYAVCSNGAVVIQIDPQAPGGYRMVDTTLFDPRPAVSILTEELPEAIIAVEEIGLGFKLSALFPEGELEGVQRVVGFDELVRDPAPRVTFRSPGQSAADFERRLEGIGLHGVSYNVGYSAWLDLAPAGVSKASGLELVRTWLGADAAGTVAIGDQRNDLEMLAWAGWGVAMGQAPPEVHRAANASTGTVEEDGLAAVLEHLARA